MRSFILMLFTLMAIGPGSAMSMSLTSDAFKDQEQIPSQFICQKEPIHPPLSWGQVPRGTVSFVLIAEACDVSRLVKTKVQWLVFNLPGTLRALSSTGALPQDALIGFNAWSHKGYQGLCPQHGLQRYRFTLYALDTRLTVNSSVYKEDILNAMEHHVLASVSLTGFAAAVT